MSQRQAKIAQAALQRAELVAIANTTLCEFVWVLSRGHNIALTDIGAAILEVSSRPIDTKGMEIMVSAAGYQTIKVKHVPRQSKGAVELNVKMEPKANAATTGASESIAAASQPDAAGGGSTPVDSSKPTFFLLGACFGLAAISAAARKVAR